MALQVRIIGRTSLNQGQRTTLTAVVTNPDGLNLTYAWTTNRGSFIGATDEVSAVFNANYLGEAIVECSVTGQGGTSAASLTAMNALGISGQLVNMFMTALGSVVPNSNNALYQDGGVGTLAAGSDQVLSSDITIWRVRWNSLSNRIILNNNQSGSLATYFTVNTDKSLYVIFEDGTYVELPQSALVSTGTTWAQWSVTDSAVVAKLNALTTTSDLVIGVADAGSVNLPSDSGVGRVRIVTEVQPLSIEAIDEQFIARNTEDYDLVIDITGNPDTVEAKGHMEGFIQDWDAVSGQLHIKSDKVTRLISGVNWDIDARRGMEQLMGQIAYNVIQAAPIFETLGTIHLYRGVPINFDIVIQNIPPLLIPNARLLGLKSDLVDYGVSVKGEIGTTDNFTINTGNVRIIVPSESGGEDTVYDFPYQIEAGGPPAIGTPEFAARGAYGSLEVADVTHALGYEWTLGEGDEATWNFFSDSRTVIDPATVEVTPGQLNVTITFPNIAGASSYEYQLVSEDSETPWKRFTGTLSNNMITTIIPDLEDGVQYKLRLRVASPWVGTPTAITVYGGRIVYCIDNANVRAADDVLYLFHTGVASGGTVTRIKRVLLPTTLENGERLAVDSDQNVYVFDKASSERSLFVFDAAVIANASDGDRISASRRNPLPVGATTAAAIVGGMKIYDGELYVHISNNSGSFRNGVRVVSTSLADGQTLTSLRSAMLASYREGLTVLQDRIYAVCTFGGIPGAGLGVYERDFGQSNIPLSTRTGLRSAAGGNVFYTSMEGLKVIDADVYIVFGGTRPALRRYRFDQAADRYTEDRSIGLPVGLLKPHGLDML